MQVYAVLSHHVMFIARISEEIRLGARVDAGTLALHALYYDLASGTMYVWNAEAEDFEATKLSEL